MDTSSITHEYQKLMASRSKQPTTRQRSGSSPPPYSAANDPSATDSELEDEASPETDEPQKIVVKATTSISGNNNLVTVPTFDPARLTAFILNELKKAGHGRVKLEIDCGLTVVGDRNVVSTGGAVALKAAAVAAMAKRKAAEAGNGEASGESKKRRADDEGDAEPEAKRTELASPSASAT